MCVGKSLSLSMGRCREELQSWKEDEEPFSELLLFFKLALQPGCSCRSVLRFIAPVVSPFCYQPPISGLPFLEKGPLAGREAPAVPTNIHQEAFQPDSAEADSQQSSPNARGLCIDLG